MALAIAGQNVNPPTRSVYEDRDMRYLGGIF